MTTSRKADIISIVKKATQEVFDEHTYNVMILYTNISDITIIIESKDPNKMCGQLKYNKKDNTIFVNMIEKCSTTGTVFLDKLNGLANELGITEISLEDKSHILFKCYSKIVKIDMPMLYILATGASWYNSKGYVSYSFEIEKEHNAVVLSKNIKTLLQELGYTDTEMSFLTKYGLDKTVNDVFSQIKKDLFIQPECELVLKLKDLLTKLKTKSFIQYNVHLNKEYISGGQRKRKPVKKVHGKK